MGFSAKLGSVIGAAALLAGLTAASAAASPASTPSQDPFYQYSGSTPLASLAPGTVLKTRTLSYHVVGIPLPLTTVQLLYRSTSQLGEPTVNATSVVKPPLRFGPSRVVSYQSAYDSLNPADQPSWAIAGNVTLGGILPSAETALFAPLLLQGYTVVVPDTEGQSADFAAGPEYGMNTLDSLRAAYASTATGIGSTAKSALLGYSGGAIATEWAAELAPSYAPDVNQHLLGAGMGGVLVDPIHNLDYVSGSSIWAGVGAIGIIGIARAFHIDVTPHLSAYGKTLMPKLESASIVNVLAQYPGLKWSDLVLPQYPTPESLPILVSHANQLIMGTGGTPTVPLFIGQGANGVVEGTMAGGPGIGAGDGVMVAGDVRSLARQYCAQGVPVQYQQYDALSHLTSLLPWAPAVLTWISARFAGVSAPQNCGSIPVGNSIAPLP